MRILSIFALLLCAGVLRSEDAKPEVKATETNVEVKQEAKKEEPKSDAPVTVNKPVIAEPKVVEVRREPELHEHPTLVEMLHKNNEMRANAGRAPHYMSPELTKAAQDHANYMAATGDFQHYSNGGPTGRANRWGHGGGVMENIAMGQMDVNTVFNTWRNSGGHWANMTSNTTAAGFGYQLSARGAPYWVAVYGN